MEALPILISLLLIVRSVFANNPDQPLQKLEPQRNCKFKSGTFEMGKCLDPGASEQKCPDGYDIQFNAGFDPVSFGCKNNGTCCLAIQCERPGQGMFDSICQADCAAPYKFQPGAGQKCDEGKKCCTALLCEDQPVNGTCVEKGQSCPPGAKESATFDDHGTTSGVVCKGGSYGDSTAVCCIPESTGNGYGAAAPPS